MANQLKRKAASKFIEEVLLIAAKVSQESGATADLSKINGEKLAKELLTKIFEAGFVLPQPCTGEAHSNPHVDNCGVCMNSAYPWGWDGDAVKVT